MNAFLAAADITFLDDGRQPVLDPMNRGVRRFFNMEEGEPEHFSRGGRLYGGFWQNLKANRRRRVRIEGEGDLYALPGLEGYRSGVKLAMNSLFWDDARYRKTWPDEMGIGVGTDADAKREPDGPAAAFSGRLPTGYGEVSTLKKALLTRHPALAPV